MNKELLEELKELGSKIKYSDKVSNDSFYEEDCFFDKCVCTGCCSNGCAMSCYAEANGYLVPPND